MGPIAAEERDEKEEEEEEVEEEEAEEEEEQETFDGKGLAISGCQLSLSHSLLQVNPPWRPQGTLVGWRKERGRREEG